MKRLHQFLLVISILCVKSITLFAMKFCPLSKEKWTERAKKLPCGGQSVYHCLQNVMTEKIDERCLEKTTVIAGQCPVLVGTLLHWKSCNESGCPTVQYISNEVYTYPICFGHINSSMDDENKEVSPNIYVVVGVVFGVAVAVIICFVIAVLLYRRGHLACLKKEKNSRKGTSESSSLEDVDSVTTDVSRSGVVRTRFVKEGLHFLNRNNCILIYGKMGNSVFSTADRVMEDFLQQNDNWTSQRYDYNEIPDGNIADNVLLIVGRFFGEWNDNPCELSKVKECLERLKGIVTGKKNKVIVCMRSEFYTRYSEELEDFDDSVLTSKISLDHEAIMKDKEQVVHFKKRMKSTLCTRKDCRCNEVKFDALKNGSRKIGMPLKIEIFANDHSLIEDFLATRDVKEALIRHFDKLKEQDPEVYECLMYTVLKGMFTEGMPLDERVLNDMKFNKISNETFDSRKSCLSKYLKPKDKTQISPKYIFWHPFIYICAFHSLYKTNPSSIIHHCNIDAILQLLRPNEDKRMYFTVAMEQNDYITFYNARVSGGEMGFKKYLASHPLVKEYS